MKPSSADTTRSRPFIGLFTALAALVLAIAVLGRSCRLPGNSPDAVVSQFVSALRMRDREAIYELLTPELQQALQAQAQRATRIVGGGRRYDALDLISMGTTELGVIALGRVITTGDVARVSLSSERGTQDIHLRRVGRVWRIDLPEYRQP